MRGEEMKKAFILAIPVFLVAVSGIVLPLALATLIFHYFTNITLSVLFFPLPKNPDIIFLLKILRSFPFAFILALIMVFKLVYDKGLQGTKGNI
jgi:hypothetical protein